MPLLDLMFSMFVFFIWVAWLLIVFRTLIDVFRSDDLGGFAKALWAIAIVVVPLIGVFVYLITRGDGMAQREVQTAVDQQKAMDNYIRQTAGTPGASTADELAKLRALRDDGVLTDQEFAAQKAKILA